MHAGLSSPSRTARCDERGRMKPDITLSMIVRDEEERLEACLASVAEYVDEMIIVDTGSTDNTVQIARQFGARIIHVPWENDFSKARNAGLEQATKQWVLCLDADERLTPVPSGYLSYLIAQEDVHGYYVRIKSFIGQTSDGEYMTDEACRLFRNDRRIRFARPIHEQVVPSLLAMPGAALLRSKLTVLHEGYLDPVIAGKNKNGRNMAIIQAALHRHPDDPEYRYAFGTEFYQQQKYDEALGFFLPLLDRHGERLGLDPGSGQQADLTVKAAYALNRTGQTEASIQLLRQGLERFSDHPEMLELLSGLYLENRRHADALSQLERAFAAGNGSAFYTTLSGSGSYRSMHLAGLAFEGLWRFGEAADRYSAALSIRPNFSPSWSRLPQLAMITDQEEQLANLLADLRNRVPPDIWVSILHETIYFRKDDFAAKIWELAPDTIRNRHYPLWEGIVLARNDVDAAFRQFKRLGSCMEAEWYLWAISVKKESGDETAIRLPPNFREPVTETLYRRCQDVLLQVCAWEGVLRWMDRFPSILAFPQLPVHRYYAYLNSPVDAIEALLGTAGRRRKTLTTRDGLALGGLAFQAGKLPDSLDWFRYAGQLDPARIEPPAAIAYVNLLIARKRLPSRLSGVIAAPDQDLYGKAVRSFMILTS